MSIAEFKKRVISVTPDGAFYLAMGEGDRVPLPYSLRWLLPRLLGDSRERWDALNRAAVPILLLLSVAYADSALVLPLLLLAPCLLFWWEKPVLVDVVGLAIALAAALLAPTLPLLAIPLAIVGGMVNEKTPIFAAIYSGNPLLLFGLAAPAAKALYEIHTDKKKGKPGIPEMPEMHKQVMRWVLDNPLLAGLATAREIVSKPLLLLGPAGGMALAVFAPSTPLVLSLIVCAGMALTATDKWRLLWWAVPPALACVAVLPTGWVVFGWMLSYLAWPVAKSYEVV